MGEPPRARATFAAKFCTTVLIMLWQRGLSEATCASMEGMSSTHLVILCFGLGSFEANTGLDRIRLRRSLAAAQGSGAATRALTTATPERVSGDGVLRGAAAAWRIRWTLLAFTPPMQTVAGGLGSDRADRQVKIERRPAVPMIDFELALLFGMRFVSQ